MKAAYLFECTACGQCCTSAPLLSVPELFRHQHRFIGALGVRRLARPIEGITSGPFFTFTHGVDHSGAGRCPALEPTGHCNLHAQGKPVACRVVPFDALLPDFAQARVLDERLRDTEHWNVGCLFRGHLEGDVPAPHRVVVKHLRVVDGGARDVIALHRRILEDEYRFWAKAVFAGLEAELCRHPPAVHTLDQGGVVTLSLAPALLSLAAVSVAMHRRCLEYVDAQLTLIDVVIRHVATTEAVASRLHATAHVTFALRRALQSDPVTVRRRSLTRMVELESWLGVSPAELASNG